MNITTPSNNAISFTDIMTLVIVILNMLLGLFTNWKMGHHKSTCFGNVLETDAETNSVDNRGNLTANDL